MTEEKDKQEQEVDAEWMQLILAAREIGVSIEQIRDFFTRQPLASQGQE